VVVKSQPSRAVMLMGAEKVAGKAAMRGADVGLVKM
jgi:hypothetical protein